MIKFKQRIMLPLLIIFTMLIITRITSADFLHFIFLNLLFVPILYQGPFGRSQHVEQVRYSAIEVTDEQERFHTQLP